MAHTIYELDLNNLPSNVSITMNSQLEEMLAEANYEKPVRKAPSFKQRLTAFALMAVLAMIPAYGCGNGPGPNPDTINPMPTGYSVSSNITPGNGTTLGPDDSDLEVGIDTPAIPAECSADSDCAAAASDGMNVLIEFVYDNGTADTSDDETVVVANHTGVPFDSYTSGTADLTAAHGGAGLADGEGIEAHVTLTARDADGVEHSVEGSVIYTYVDDTPVEPEPSCKVHNAYEGGGLNITCTATSSLGYTEFTWAANSSSLSEIVYEDHGDYVQIALPGGLNAAHRGLHDLGVTATDIEGNTGNYDNQFNVNEFEVHAEFVYEEGGSDTTLSTEEFANRLAPCGTGFVHPSVSGLDTYVFEISRASDGDSAMDCLDTGIDTTSTEESWTLTMYTPDGESTVTGMINGRRLSMLRITYEKH